MENEEKTPQNTAPEPANQPTNNSSSTVGSEGSRYDSGSTQASYQDPDHLENQESGAARGEFGAHGHQGHTHGGYGNQARILTDPIKEDDQPQTGSAAPDGYQARTGNGDQGQGMGGSGSQQNDNGSGPGLGQGFSADYGNTSGGSPTPHEAAQPAAGTARNQSEDDHSSRGGYDNQGHPDDDAPRQPDVQASEEAPGENGRANSYSGSISEGHGSQGGSYNDEYDSADDKSQSGSPARGDYDSQDQSHNYGQGSRAQNRPANSDDPDYGAAPHRNSGRDDEQ
jgi:hypothetical protein